MMSRSDLPEVLAVFPLAGALLLPRARLPLRIFEPRYLAMVEDCLKTRHRLIGMIQPRLTASGEERLQAIGCAGRLTSFAETDDGRYMITLSGVCRFRALEDAQGFSPYRRCAVSWADFDRDLGLIEEYPAFRREPLIASLGKYFAKLNLSTDWNGLQDAEPELLINSLAMLCPFSPEDKQALLEAPTLADRREMLMTLIEFSLRSGNEETLQ